MEANRQGGFLFRGNQAALDFVNTRPLRNGVETELLPDFAALVRWMVAAGLLDATAAARLRRRWETSARARRALAAARQLREMLRKEIKSWEQGGAVQPATIARLNRLLAQHPTRTRIQGTTLVPWFEARVPEDLLAPLAHAAALLLTQVDRARVRQCAGCIVHFLDTSKKGTRRWCSMQLCGNRVKVAAYAARRRAS